MIFRCLKLLALASVALSCTCTRPFKGPGPNILLLVLDAARADRFGCYGYERPTTPNIDRLAAEGARFKQAYSTSSWTLPAHASLFTGLLPDENKTHSRHAWLVDRIPTLAERLASKGYRTAAFSNNPYVDRSENLHRGFERFEAVWADTAVTDSVHPYNTPHTNRLVKAYLEEADSSAGPFFVFINYMDTHMPYGPPEPYRSMYRRGEPVDSARLDSLCRYNEMLNSGRLTPTGDEIAAVEAVYDGALTYLDAQIGELLDYLRERKIYDNTLVVLLSDHGEVYGEYGWYTHGGVLNRPLIQIPLIIRCPALVPVPVVREELVSITDIFHTIARLVGFEGMPSGSPARDLLADRIEAAPCYSKLLFGRHDVESPTGRDARSVVAPGLRHFILCADKSWECYDLGEDFGEASNLVPGRVSRAGVERAVIEFEKNLIVLQETPADLTVSGQFRVDPQRAGALRALGYAGGSAGSLGNLHPHVAEHLNIGILYSLRGEYDQAEKELRTAFGMDPDNRDIKRSLGFTLYNIGKLDEAVRVLRSLVAGGEADLLVRLVLGQALEKSGRTAEALEQYLAASDLQPRDTEAALGAARLSIAGGRPDQAGRVIDRLLSLHPGDTKLMSAAVSLYLTASRWQEARGLLLEAVKREKSVANLQNLAVCSVHLGLNAEARGWLQELLKMDIPPDLRQRAQMQLNALKK
ncbi:MAG: sulfatase-like hydrolase/transferase [Candidatus Glassbacteria bacterium]